MRLTDKSRWRYVAPPLTRKEAEAITRRDDWIGKIRELLPNRPLDVLELGCAPGNYSAAVMLDRPYRPFGIDYSDNSELYVITLRGLGLEPTLYERDLFGEPISRTFGVVCSFGLIEHFRGKTLDELLEIHDRYLTPGGYLVIAVPNFTGFQYLWHYLFDRPDLDNHNVDVMQPATFRIFEELGYETLYLDYHGQMRLWGNSGWTFSWITGKIVAAIAKTLSLLASLLGRIGVKLTGRSYSPFLLYVGKKPRE